MKRFLLLTVIFLFIPLIAQSQTKGTWITRAPMPILVTEHAAIALNGKIYCIGGLVPDGTTTNKVFVYNPASNTWDTAAPLPQPRHHFGIAVYNGKIYVLAGYTGNPFEPKSNVYEYNPVNDTWTEKAPAPTPRGGCCAAEYGGKIYLFGGAGFSLNNSNNVNEVYDPAADTWETKKPMITSRDHLMTAVLDTVIYAIAGRNFNLGHGAYDIVEAYSPATDSWYPVPVLNVARGGPAVDVMGGKIYAIGGEWWGPGNTSGLTPEVEEYHPEQAWNIVNTMPTPRHGIGCAAVGDTIYTIGGGTQAGFSYSNINEGYVPDMGVYIQNNTSAVTGYRLYRNYPNPFNPSTNIKFDIPEASHVKLTISDILGREVASLVNGELKAGSYTAAWDGTGNAGGIYIYTLTAGGIVRTGKMMMVK
jgi:N-acetylneuraminic acid mutarotase